MTEPLPLQTISKSQIQPAKKPIQIVNLNSEGFPVGVSDGVFVVEEVMDITIDLLENSPYLHPSAKTNPSSDLVQPMDKVSGAQTRPLVMEPLIKRHSNFITQQQGNLRKSCLTLKSNS